MKRAVIYSRFSSEDHQTSRSIDDQEALCRAHAERNGWVVVQTYSDHGISGATVHGRVGFARMITDAKARRFEIVVAEDIDRLTRNQADAVRLREQMEFIGVELHTVADGKVTQLHAGLKGLMSSLFLENLRLHVWRGQAGNIRAGKHGGGLAYGYRVVPGKPGEWVINDDEAAVIRRVFAEYVAGDIPREIAGGLNRDGIRPPRGRYWRQNTLTGSNNRHNGILSNEMYAGRMIWNRVRMVKNPDTGKRVSRVNPESEWHRVDVPHLRIVDPDLFEAAQRVRAARSKKPGGQRQKNRHMLSGLLRCGACSGGMSIKDRDHGRYRIACSTWKEARSCSNSRAYYLDDVERIVVEGLRRHLIAPAAIRRFLKTYTAERRRLAANVVNVRADLERQIAEVTRKLERAMAAMLASSAAVESFTAVIAELDGERTRLEAQLADLAEPVNVVALHPAAVERYLAMVTELSRALQAGQGAAQNELAASVRDLIEHVTVRPSPAGAPLDVHIAGRLAALIGAPVFPDGSLSGGAVVAEEGLEPPTRGL